MGRGRPWWAMGNTLATWRAVGMLVDSRGSNPDENVSLADNFQRFKHLVEKWFENVRRGRHLSIISGHCGG